MDAARSVACLALDPPQLRRDLFTDKPLGFAKTRCMAFQTVWIILHPPQPGKRVGMGVFFPFLEVFKMTKATLPVPYIVRLFCSENIRGEELERAGYQGREDCSEEQSHK